MSNLDPFIHSHLKMNVPSFLIKTYEILENESLSNLISWNKEGTAFIVYNPNELSTKVLANYFKHKNYPSFLRQLNMYNFKKTRNQYGSSEFRHKWFRKGQKNMIQYIRRRNQEESEFKIDLEDQNKELDLYKQEHQNMKNLLKDLQKSHETMQKNIAQTLDQSSSLNKQNYITLQNINRIQLDFNKKYDYVTIMLTNVLTNLPNLCMIQNIQKTVTNFKKIIKICQDETNLQQSLPYLENGQTYQNPSIIPYNQFQHYTQKQQPFYFYDQKQLSYTNGPQLAITDIQNNFCSPTTHSLPNSQQNSPFRFQNLSQQQYLLDYANIDLYNLYQQV